MQKRKLGKLTTGQERTTRRRIAKVAESVGRVIFGSRRIIPFIPIPMDLRRQIESRGAVHRFCSARFIGLKLLSDAAFSQSH